MNTTIMNHEETRRRLMLQRAIGDETDEIVRTASQTARLLGPGEHSASDMKENQIRNVLNVATETLSVEVVVNFIRYQMGRSGQGKTWLYNGFGQQVIADIGGPVGEAAKRAAKEAAEAVGGADEKALCREAHLVLTRLYIGYLNRCFYYGDKTGQWDELHKGKGVCDDVS